MMGADARGNVQARTPGFGDPLSLYPGLLNQSPTGA